MKLDEMTDFYHDNAAIPPLNILDWWNLNYVFASSRENNLSTTEQVQALLK